MCSFPASEKTKDVILFLFLRHLPYKATSSKLPACVLPPPELADDNNEIKFLFPSCLCYPEFAMMLLPKEIKGAVVVLLVHVLYESKVTN